MPRHCVVIVAGLVVVATNYLSVLPAWAGAGSGEAWGNGSIHRGIVTATATVHRPGHPTSPSPSADVPTTTDPPSRGGSTTTTLSPTAPYCTYTPAGPELTAALGAGGPTPGEWYYLDCFNEGVTNPSPPIWIADSTPAPTPAPAPSLPAVATQALRQAPLVNPTIVLNPSGPQVVNFASWLAISPTDWHAVVASVTDGGVAVTVTATPTSVLWNLGNGAALSCAGPGVLYNSSLPANSQSTYCTYTWPAPSFSQPNGIYDVTATIEYQVATAVTGATNTTPNLGTHLGPTAHATVEVTEVEALGTAN